eukprot:TRINITY_DN13249_c0_g1_i1.p1 TRINITY_DN13249_c0_g1~~TRINITY_DN13249_c0_g1_i1.p1  ORF type:complete len:167 (-),score=8.85 TRINITY_DN13249_c0_g1_i1:28-492(-)
MMARGCRRGLVFMGAAASCLFGLAGAQAVQPRLWLQQLRQVYLASPVVASEGAGVGLKAVCTDGPDCMSGCCIDDYQRGEVRTCHPHEDCQVPLIVYILVFCTLGLSALYILYCLRENCGPKSWKRRPTSGNIPYIRLSVNTVERRSTRRLSMS